MASGFGARGSVAALVLMAAGMVLGGALCVTAAAQTPASPAAAAAPLSADTGPGGAGAASGAPSAGGAPATAGFWEGDWGPAMPAGGLPHISVSGNTVKFTGMNGTPKVSAIQMTDQVLSFLAGMQQVLLTRQADGVATISQTTGGQNRSGVICRTGVLPCILPVAASPVGQPAGATAAGAAAATGAPSPAPAATDTFWYGSWGLLSSTHVIVYGNNTVQYFGPMGNAFSTSNVKITAQQLSFTFGSPAATVTLVRNGDDAMFTFAPASGQGTKSGMCRSNATKCP